MEPEDIIGHIEQKNGYADTGRTSFIMLKSAKEEGATQTEAFLAVAAYYAGMFMAMNLDEDVDDLLDDVEGLTDDE